MIPTTQEPAPIPCPHCRGRGHVEIHVFGHRADGSHFSGPRVSTCNQCGGAGTITPECAALIAEGDRRREDRKSRKLSLREEAARLGIGPKKLNDIEWGRSPEPDP